MCSEGYNILNTKIESIPMENTNSTQSALKESILGLFTARITWLSVVVHKASSFTDLFFRAGSTIHGHGFSETFVVLIAVSFFIYCLSKFGWQEHGQNPPQEIDHVPGHCVFKAACFGKNLNKLLQHFEIEVNFQFYECVEPKSFFLIKTP